MKFLSVFRFRPRDRKQRDAFTELPVTHVSAPRFEDPHGIATDATLAGIRARAAAEALSQHADEAIAVCTPGYPPPASDQAVILDMLPAAAREPVPPMPFSGVSKIMVSRIDYPDPADLSYDKDRHYREMLRRIGAATGTSTSLEDTGTWPRLALEPGDGTGVSL